MSRNKLKENRKEQILKAALKLFVVNGYSDTRMDDIAIGSGLSKGAIYHHYASKNDLFIALIDYWEETFLPAFMEVIKLLVSKILSAFPSFSLGFCGSL